MDFNNVKAVLFDLDGTLFDTMLIWRQIDMDFLDSHGYDVDYIALQKDIEGMSMGETAEYFIKRFNMENTVEELVHIWIDMSIDYYKYKVKEKPGAIEFVKELKKKGIKTAVASSNSRLLIETVLKANGIYDCIDTIVTSHEVAQGKPAPDVYLKAAENIGVEPKDCLVFEDVLAGILAGKAAGASVIAIWDEYSQFDWKEKKETADYYIEDYYELIKDLNGK